MSGAAVSAAAAASSAAATATRTRRAGRAGPAPDGHRGQQLDGVVVALRAGRRVRRLAHRAGLLERVAASAATVLISRHGLSLPPPGQLSPAARSTRPPRAALARTRSTRPHAQHSPARAALARHAQLSPARAALGAVPPRNICQSTRIAAPQATGAISRGHECDLAMVITIVVPHPCRRVFPVRPLSAKCNASRHGEMQALSRRVAAIKEHKPAKPTSPDRSRSPDRSARWTSSLPPDSMPGSVGE
jgi:hypothetical protein